MARVLALLALLVTTPSVLGVGLRCNTYLGTDFSQGGAGIETCLAYTTECAQREFFVLGVRTYSMSCDDLFQCKGLPKNICCTKAAEKLVLRCSGTNFPEWKINSTSFGPECSAACP